MESANQAAMMYAASTMMAARKEHERRDGKEGVDGKPRIDNKLSERKRGVMEIKCTGKFLQADKTLKAGNRHQHDSCMPDRMRAVRRTADPARSSGKPLVHNGV